MIGVGESSETKGDIETPKTAEIGRAPTGIPGLDEMIEGGFKRGSINLVVGGCGSGKSTLCMQYLYNGAKSDEPGVYVTFEEFPEKMKDNFARYGWELDELERQQKLRIKRIEPTDVLNVINEDYGPIVDAVNDIKAKRVVIDSISTIELMIQDPFKKRESILRLCEWLGKHNCTSLIVSESEQTPATYSRYGITEFVVDGVIVMYNLQEGTIRQNAIEVLKMRGTKHLKRIVPFAMDDGVRVFPSEQMFGGLEMWERLKLRKEW